MKWFPIYPTTQEMAEDVKAHGVVSYARKREDGLVEQITVREFHPHVDTTRTEIRTADSIKMFWELREDAYGYIHPTSSKNAATLNSLWNFHARRNMVVRNANQTPTITQ